MNPDRSHRGETLHVKQLIGSSIAASLDLLLLSFACYLSFKVYKLVKFTDLPMLLSIISIAISLVCMLAFQIWSILGDLQSQSGFFNSNIADCIANSFDTMKLTFLFFAFTFDLYKWCVFLAATGTT